MKQLWCLFCNKNHEKHVQNDMWSCDLLNVFGLFYFCFVFKVPPTVGQRKERKEARERAERSLTFSALLPQWTGWSQCLPTRPGLLRMSSLSYLLLGTLMMPHFLLWALLDFCQPVCSGPSCITSSCVVSWTKPTGKMFLPGYGKALSLINNGIRYKRSPQSDRVMK